MESTTATRALAALAQDHRLAAFRFLVQRGDGGAAAGAIADHLGIAPSSLSFHLAQLEHAGLVLRVRRGRSLIYSADFARMNALIGYLTENCCGGAATCAPVANCPPLAARPPVAERNAA